MRVGLKAKAPARTDASMRPDCRIQQHDEGALSLYSPGYALQVEGVSVALIALLDDVAATAKAAAASLDDIAGQAVKAGAKSAGVVIDDAALRARPVAGTRDPDRRQGRPWLAA
jgi:hypothetical protein